MKLFGFFFFCGSLLHTRCNNVLDFRAKRLIILYVIHETPSLCNSLWLCILNVFSQNYDGYNTRSVFSSVTSSGVSQGTHLVNGGVNRIPNMILRWFVLKKKKEKDNYTAVVAVAEFGQILSVFVKATTCNPT